MAAPESFKPADFGGEASDIENQVGNRLYKKVVLEWSKPQVLDPEYPHPFFKDNRPLLYLITRDHGNMKRRGPICYVGLSTNPENRFANHPTARALAERRGETCLSYAFIDPERSTKRLSTLKRALEEIEHILIWALWENEQLENDRKLYTLPGMGTIPGQAWHIVNEGHRFRGRLPKAIIYPWMLVNPGRDRSQR